MSKSRENISKDFNLTSSTGVVLIYDSHFYPVSHMIIQWYFFFFLVVRLVSGADENVSGHLSLTTLSHPNQENVYAMSRKIYLFIDWLALVSWSMDISRHGVGWETVEKTCSSTLLLNLLSHESSSLLSFHCWHNLGHLLKYYVYMLSLSVLMAANRLNVNSCHIKGLKISWVFE